MAKMSAPGLNVNKAFEGCALRAYRDEVGVITIGYGITNYDPVICKKYFGGPLTMGTTITQAQADASMEEAVDEHYMPAVEKALPGQPQNVQDGGGIFHYNTGAIAKASWPKSWMAGNKDAAKASIGSWNKAGGKVLAGLTRRRAREWAIIESADYGPEGKVHAVVLDEKGHPTGAVVPIDHPSDAPAGTVPSTSNQMMWGQTGPQVAALQKDLKELKVYDGLDAEGTFGDHTERAVRDFQKAHSALTEDGRVGPATRATINRELDLVHQAKGAVKKVGGTGAVIATGTSAKSSTGAIVVLVMTSAAVVGVLIWLAIKYRAEIAARYRRATGQTTP
jgi:lysozyme